MLPGMASITSKGWTPSATVTVYKAVEAGRTLGAAVTSAQADSTGNVTIDGLTERVRYTADDGVLRRSFMVPDQGQANRSSGLGGAESDVLADLQTRVPLLESRTVDVRAYGAKGDAATDDSAAIQAAVDAVNSAGGGVVFLVPGTYILGSPITWRTKVSLLGSGAARTILKPKSTISGAAIQAGGSLGSPFTDCTFSDFAIDGSDVPTSTSSKGIFITYMLRARFERLYVHHTTATGLGCDFLRDTVFDRCVVENCGRAAIGSETTVAGCSGIGIGAGASQVENVVVSHCVARNNARYGIFVEFQSSIATLLSRGVEFVDNLCDGNFWGIGSCGVERARIIGNLVTGSTSHGIHIGVSDATHGALSIGDQVLGNVISLNGGRGINIDASALGGFGSYTYQGDYKISRNLVRSNTGVGVKITSSAALIACSIDGNQVKSGSSLGIDVSGPALQDSFITDNLVLDNTGIGIRLLGNLTRVRVANNRSGDTRSGGSRTQTYGVEVSVGFTVTDCEIRDNDLRNNTTGAINVAGTIASATRVENNLGYNPLGTDTLAVTASPMTYTAGPQKETLYVIGGTWTTVSINGVNVATTAPGVLQLDPYDVVVFTYTAAPTAIKRQRH